jgi:flavin-dependent dehydrogenase
MITSIIGGGIVGGYLAGKIGGDVRIFEEHRKIGEPVQCSGLFTHNISDFVKIKKDFLVNEINGVRLVSSSGNSCEFDLKQKDFVLDRAKLDTHIVEMAVGKGAKLYLGHKFTGVKDGKLRFGNGKIADYDVVVGADGPNSSVNKVFFNNPAGKFWVGKQARVRMKSEGDVFEVDFSIPGFFGWVIPENERVARVGVACERGVMEHFDKFLKKKRIEGVMRADGVMDIQAGVIPVYNPKVKLWNGHKAFLVGDSAGMVKALSGGGVIPGLKAGRILAEAVNSGDYSSYEKRFRREVGGGLWRNLKVREFLNKFNEKDYDKLIYLLEKNDFNGFDREKINFFEIIKMIKPEIAIFLLKKLFS